MPEATSLFDRVPPYDEAAERGVLGSMMLEDRAAGIAVEMLTPDDFYLKPHREIFRVLVERYDRGEPLDLLLVRDELQRRGMLEGIGGMAFLGALVDGTPNAANIEAYCRIVEEKAILRSITSSCTEILQQAYEEAVEPPALLDLAQQKMMSIAERRNRSGAETIQRLLGDFLTEAERTKALRDSGQEIPLRAIPTHIPRLNELLAGGLWQGEFIVIAARPSVGKTTFALNIIKEVALKPPERMPRPVVFYTLEMTKEQIAKNLLCIATGIDTARMRRMEFDEEDMSAVRSAIQAYQSAPLFLDDTAAPTVRDIRARARRLKQQHGIEMVVIDYLQLMSAPGGRRDESRQAEVAEISRGLKSLAREMNVPVVVLSQLNRAPEGTLGRAPRKPRLADLRESGAIEQDADVVMLLHRPEEEGGEEAAEAPRADVSQPNLLLILAKNRNGATGEVHLSFDKPKLRIGEFCPATVTA
ncbi:MAG: replicative DNA helicase [Planctomycetota bacterium]|nr:replicative DNA helicase [Planctomycetota bacterium]